MDKQSFAVALMWHGDREARDTATFEGHRFQKTAEALRTAGLAPEPAVYNDDFADEVREQLLSVDGVLVWVNPIPQPGRDRTALDALLRDVAGHGIFISAHPDVILKLGTKEVLYQTREMSWGTDTYLYTTLDEMREQLPLRLAAGKPRVLKQYRGNDGNGVWKVNAHPDDPSLVCVRHAQRGSPEEDMTLDDLLDRCAGYFTGSGRMIDQEYQERLTDGMVRCYLVHDKVAGFGHQAINALYPAPPGVPVSEAPLPSPRYYHPPTTPEFQPIRQKMEEEWVGELCRTLEIEREDLPIIWDADFLFGARTASGEDTYVLGEINVSSVYPFPDEALVPLAQATKERLLRQSRS